MRLEIAVFFTIAMFVGCLAGCGDSYQPSARSSQSAKPADDASESQSGSSGAKALDATAAKSDLSTGVVSAGGVKLTAPAAWTRKPPRSSFVLAEFSLPKAEGDDSDGRLTVSVAGGSVEANIDRWRGQFGGSPEKDSTDTLDVAGIKLTVVDLAGTFNDQPGPFAPGVQREAYRMLAAIVPSAGNQAQLVFIKAYGPQKTMAAQEEAFQAFLKTIERSDGGN